MIDLARGRKCGKPASGGWTRPSAAPAFPPVAPPDAAPIAVAAPADFAASIAIATPPRRRPVVPKNCRRFISLKYASFITLSQTDKERSDREDPPRGSRDRE